MVAEIGIAAERWEGVQYAKRGERSMNHLRLKASLVGAVFAGLAVAAAAQAQTYPSRPITVIVPFPPGGLTDVPARVMATLMSRSIGQSVVIENKTGGSGTIGVAVASRAAPDGYTLLGNSLADTQNLHFAPITYNPIDDFAQIGWIVDGPPMVAIVNSKLPYKTFAEFVAAAKANPKSISFGTSGPFSGPAMALALMNQLAGIDVVAVPYRGSGDAAQAVASGAIHGVIAFYSQAKPLVDDGKVRALAIAAPVRMVAWPGVPTFQDLGYKLDFRGFVGLAAPAKTPKPIVDLLSKHLNAVVQSDVFKSRMEPLGMAAPPAADNTPEKYDAYMRAEVARQGEIAKLLKAQSPPQQK
jgi:tripartite-type tricarboxylate transporter receptor subunit TctC